MCGGAAKSVCNAVLYQNRAIMLEIKVLEIFLVSVSASAQIPDQATMLIFTNILDLDLVK